ncbi:MAG: DUF4179 domain-containing protein [Roseburia sp.]|nr:DUF4179 domain-containing protein [Roseburia sp.]
MTDERLDQILKQALAPEIDDTEIRIHRRRKSKMRILGKGIAAAVAAAVIGIGGLGYFNPALAARLPIIGRIFEKVEGNVTYSGDYADKASILTQEDAAGNPDTAEYSVSDSGIMLTASEVYCDGYSIFLTVCIEAEDADFTHIPEHYTRMKVTDSRTAAGFYIDGTWSVDGRPAGPLRNTFDGEVIDSHTFAGLLKMDVSERLESGGELRLDISGLGYDDDRMFDSEEISASHWTDGNWNMVLPFTVDASEVRTFAVNEKNGDIALDNIVVSPYQVIVHVTTPGEQRELTDDRREKLLSENPDLTDAEMFEILGWSYEPCYTVVFNQDGECLYPDMEMAGRAGFAVQGKEIKVLHVFIFDNLEDCTQMEEEGMNSSAAQKAVIAAEISVE